MDTTSASINNLYSHSRRTDLLIGILIFVFLVYIYTYTAAPSVYDGDSGELSATVSSLGLAHPTGFPLYILTGKLFSLFVPIKDVAYRLNIYSSILTALAVAFVFFALRNLGISKLPALTSSLIAGFGNTIWSHAGAARVYALSILIAAILLFLFTRWISARDKKCLYYYALLLGIGFGAHMLIVLMTIPLLFMLGAERAWRDRKIFLLTFLPLVQYIYLPIAYLRNQIVTFGEINNVRGLFYYISQRDYVYKITERGTPGLINFLKETLVLFASEFTVILLLVAILGVIVLWQKNRTIFWTIMLIVATNIFIMCLYGNNQDMRVLFRYFFISYIGVSVFIAFALEFVVQQIKKIKKSVIICLLSSSILALPIIPLRANLASNDRHKNFIISDYAENILRSTEPNSILISEGDSISGPLWYLQSQGERNDILIIDKQMLGWDWYIRNLKKKYPGVINPSLLTAKDKEDRLRRVVLDNFQKYPIYTVFFDEKFNNKFLKEYQLIPIGITYKIVGKDWSNAEFLHQKNNDVWDEYVLRGLESKNYNKSFFVEIDAKNYSAALNNLGTFYIEVGLLKEAKRVLNKSLEIHPVLETTVQHNLDLIQRLELKKERK